jgi:hypothetical protein
MKTVLQRLVRYTGLSCALAGLCTLPAKAVITLSLTPSAQTINVGDIAAVNLNISGLDSTIIGGWYVELDFNTAILETTNVAFSSYFTSSYQDYGVGLSPLYILESADPGSSLSGNGTFTLATISFRGLTPGTSSVFWAVDGNNVQWNSLSDQDGYSNTISFENAPPIEITVRAAPQGVPDATATLPLVAAVGFLLAFRRHGRRTA